MSLISLNVRGLKPTQCHPDKTRNVFHLLARFKASVLCLQETHLLDDHHLPAILHQFKQFSLLLSNSASDSGGILLASTPPSTPLLISPHFIASTFFLPPRPPTPPTPPPFYPSRSPTARRSSSPSPAQDHRSKTPKRPTRCSPRQTDVAGLSSKIQKPCSTATTKTDSWRSYRSWGW